ncbi:MAG: HAD-IA family hydrolase [Pseudomonadota bacterium]
MTLPRHDGVIAWDFDGVLNRNVIDGRVVWPATFTQDIGHPWESFETAIFGTGFDEVITGRVDLRDRLAAWADAVGYGPGADALLAYWFARDALPDDDMLRMAAALEARGVRQVIATNNEARRAAYIEREMGFATRVERIFASGRMGVAKPDPVFFAQVTADLDVAPARMVLIDDHAGNVAAARDCGWAAFHLTDESRGDLRAYLGLAEA